VAPAFGPSGTGRDFLGIYDLPQASLWILFSCEVPHNWDGKLTLFYSQWIDNHSTVMCRSIGAQMSPAMNFQQTNNRFEEWLENRCLAIGCETVKEDLKQNTTA